MGTSGQDQRPGSDLFPSASRLFGDVGWVHGATIQASPRRVYPMGPPSRGSWGHQTERGAESEADCGL